jgi:adenylate cyclase
MTLAPLQAWLIDEGRRQPDVPMAMKGLGALLAQAGFDPLRINLQLHTLHPLVATQMHIWQQPHVAPHSLSREAYVIDHGESSFEDALVQKVDLAHGAFESESFRKSPMFLLKEGVARYVRRPIPADGSELEFPILDEMQRQGATDYLALRLDFSARRHGSLGIVSQRAGGLTEAQVEELIALAPALSACFDPHLGAHVARTLLDTYVGRRSGERVLAGRIRGGDSERIEAAIWFSDLRGFTTISRAVEPAVLVSWLNAYFEAICRPIAAHGGEILKFIGDAVLAVFPVGTDPTEACRAALSAATAAHRGLRDLNAARAARSAPPLQHGIALHLGEVQYGNIGAEARLDFTVIGRAVNLASRLEGLCGRLGRQTVTSASFARHADSGLASLGSFDLKGIGAPEEAFGLDEPP